MPLAVGHDASDKQWQPNNEHNSSNSNRDVDRNLQQGRQDAESRCRDNVRGIVRRDDTRYQPLTAINKHNADCKHTNSQETEPETSLGAELDGLLPRHAHMMIMPMRPNTGNNKSQEEPPN